MPKIVELLPIDELQILFLRDPEKYFELIGGE